MKRNTKLICGALALAYAVFVVPPARATTLVRASLDDLAMTNSTVVVGEVLDATSYWNENHTFILTDVRVAPVEVLKGDVRDREITVTLMGGSVGELTTLILSGAELVPGRSYVMFLNRAVLPGAAQALTVRDHCQGAFDVVMTGNGLRAVSQASRHPLMPDAFGRADAPGGAEGLPFETLRESVREIARRSQASPREVKP